MVNEAADGVSPLTRPCQGPGGSTCPGSTETCVDEFWSGVCVAPPESCNGFDDDCDGYVDESGVCQ